MTGWNDWNDWIDRTAFRRPRWIALAVLTWALLLGGAALAVASLWLPWAAVGWIAMGVAAVLVLAWEAGWRP